jgi:biopolymer transport protein ExbD
MDFRAEEGETSGWAQIVSLLGLLFLLMALTVSLRAFSAAERDFTIALPAADSASRSERGPRDLLLNVRADGRLVLNGREMSLGEFEQMLSRLSRELPTDGVIVRADGRSPHRVFVEVLDVCRRHGVRSVSVVAAESGGAGAPRAEPGGGRRAPGGEP